MTTLTARSASVRTAASAAGTAEWRAAAIAMEAGMGAAPVVTFSPPANARALTAGAQLRVTDVDGKTYATRVG